MKNEIKQENITYNEMTNAIFTQTPNTYNYQENSGKMNKRKLKKRKKDLNSNSINNKKQEKMNYYRNQSQKQISKDYMTNLNSKLSSENYVKPLYYLLNSQLKPINKQFIGFKYENNFIYGFPTNRNNNENLEKYKLSGWNFVFVSIFSPLLT